MDHSAKVLRDSPIPVHRSYFCVLASKSACRPYALFFSGFGSKPGSKSSITAFHRIHSQYRPKEHGFEVSGRLASMPWRTSGCAWCTSNYGSTCMLFVKFPPWGARKKGKTSNLVATVRVNSSGPASVPTIQDVQYSRRLCSNELPLLLQARQPFVRGPWKLDARAEADRPARPHAAARTRRLLGNTQATASQS